LLQKALSSCGSFARERYLKLSREGGSKEAVKDYEQIILERFVCDVEQAERSGD